MNLDMLLFFIFLAVLYKTQTDVSQTHTPFSAAKNNNSKNVKTQHFRHFYEFDNFLVFLKGLKKKGGCTSTSLVNVTTEH